jgi:hypothetical protein
LRALSRALVTKQVATIQDTPRLALESEYLSVSLPGFIP